MILSVHQTLYGRFILTENGGAFANGYGYQGRLGTGTSDTTGFTSPVRLEVNNIMQMHTSDSSGIALTGDGAVHYWPEALGTSTTSGSSTDYDLAEMATSSFTETSPVRFLRAGGNYQTIAYSWWCVVFENEYAPPECWGYNQYYQLAQGSSKTNSWDVPLQVQGLPHGNITDLQFSEYASACAVINASSVWCWGGWHEWHSRRWICNKPVHACHGEGPRQQHYQVESRVRTRLRGRGHGRRR